MSVYEMAKRYYPRLWDKSRIEALVAAGRLTEEEVEEILQGGSQSNNNDRGAVQN